METSAGYIWLTYAVDPDEETKQYVARCVELAISTAGDTVDEAFENIADAVELYLSTLEEEGERERTLTELGILIQHGEPQVAFDRAIAVTLAAENVTLPSLRRPASSYAPRRKRMLA